MVFTQLADGLLLSSLGLHCCWWVTSGRFLRCCRSSAQFHISNAAVRSCCWLGPCWIQKPGVGVDLCYLCWFLLAQIMGSILLHLPLGFHLSACFGPKSWDDIIQISGETLLCAPPLIAICRPYLEPARFARQNLSVEMQFHVAQI